MPRAAEMRTIARYRQAGGGVGREPVSLEDFELPDELKTTIARAGSPSEIFLLYDSSGDLEYGGKRLLVFASDWAILKFADARHWFSDVTFNPRPGRGGRCDPPEVFLRCTPNCEADRAEILHSLWGILCATFGEKILTGSCQVTEL